MKNLEQELNPDAGAETQPDPSQESSQDIEARRQAEVYAKLAVLGIEINVTADKINELVAEALYDPDRTLGSVLPTLIMARDWSKKAVDQLQVVVRAV
ncbi:MAG: hypothetical protein COY80_02480 [Candidatus Pacebacteria bacterium CG_4_10_14_0_8_um_filter_42_14]|nr:MAG: hypothetical protein COY80_02480 [Candidatus Pacebacteria bacterium CG_4_10_14_0_8_um_filter_42_14]